MLAALALVLALAVAAPSPPDGGEQAWLWLDELRSSLVREGVVASDFTQIFTPAGFAADERERGQLALALPDCLRWDYEEPFVKSFLICGDLAYQWNPGEPLGRRARLVAHDEPGLDLLLLTIGDLKRRYRASAEERGDARVVVLAPATPSLDIASASLGLARDAARLLWIEYRDAAGDRTRFEFTAHRKLADRSAFTPPPEVEWREE